VLAGHCAELGTDFGSIVRSANYNVVIGATEADVADKLSWLRAHYEPYLSADVLESSYRQYASGPLVGTPEQIVERLTDARGLGMTYAITYFVDAAYDRSSIDLFTEQVIPALTD
jgi:alkanesulfonate monooxygenase SsuD/methylene tetrahydromethanopterin reductase-like flavin-dependent oxidoreductase (luciferase family)